MTATFEINCDALEINCDALTLSDDQFFQLCQDNRDLRIERTTEEHLIIMPPTGGETGDRNSEINFQLRLWNKKSQLGKVFDSSTGFKLSIGSDRSPDAAWVAIARWNALTAEQRQRFLPLAPDFVIELMSPSDRPSTVREKMQEYLDSGTRLAWLINEGDRQVEIYRFGKEKEIANNPEVLSGEDVLVGFELDLSAIW
jgi:Uma2 family endonuclease